MPVTNFTDSTSQGELALKAPLASPTFTGTVDLPATTSIGDVSAAEISYLNDVTSPLQAQIDDLTPNSLSVGTIGSLALDFATYDWLNEEINVDSTITIANLAAGKLRYCRIKNTHAATTINITLPTHIGDSSPAAITAGKYVIFSFFYDGASTHILYTDILT